MPSMIVPRSGASTRAGHGPGRRRALDPHRAPCRGDRAPRRAGLEVRDGEAAGEDAGHDRRAGRVDGGDEGDAGLRGQAARASPPMSMVSVPPTPASPASPGPTGSVTG